MSQREDDEVRLPFLLFMAGVEIQGGEVKDTALDSKACIVQLRKHKTELMGSLGNNRFIYFK